MKKSQHQFIGVSRRWGLVILNLLLHHRIIYQLIGWWNSKSSSVVSVFVAYPASTEYASFYFAESLMQRAKWSPILCAVMRQNGKWILGFGISSTETELCADVNGTNLRSLIERTEQLQQFTRAQYMSFSGILPGLLQRRGLINDSVEAAVTVHVIAQAEALVRKAEGILSETPIIVLGGRGFIGTQLMKELNGRDAYSVDTSMPSDTWPAHLAGQRAILINVASKKALRQYLDLVWPELILLNEVYPEPSKKEVDKFSRHGNAIYHVVGVRANSWPSFPKAYAGGIPCCAGWPCEDLEALIRRLN